MRSLARRVRRVASTESLFGSHTLEGSPRFDPTPGIPRRRTQTTAAQAKGFGARFQIKVAANSPTKQAWQRLPLRW